MNPETSSRGVLVAARVRNRLLVDFPSRTGAPAGSAASWARRSATAESYAERLRSDVGDITAAP